MEITVDENGEIAFREFNPLEAFHIAVRIEEQGLAFYERLLSEFHDPEIEKVLRHLETLKGLV
ncbi:MAG: hypothetical protein ACYTHM_15515 [Planctomycetota bacterium]|jgi:rubrerythrin